MGERCVLVHTSSDTRLERVDHICAAVHHVVSKRRIVEACLTSTCTDQKVTIKSSLYKLCTRVKPKYWARTELRYRFMPFTARFQTAAVGSGPTPPLPQRWHCQRLRQHRRPCRVLLRDVMSPSRESRRLWRSWRCWHWPRENAPHHGASDPQGQTSLFQVPARVWRRCVIMRGGGDEGGGVQVRVRAQARARDRAIHEEGWREHWKNEAKERRLW